MKNFISSGDQITLPGPVTAGTPVVVGANFLAIPAITAPTGSNAPAHVRGVFDLPKLAQVVAQGQRVYWTGSAVSTAPTGNRSIGSAMESQTTGVSGDLVEVNINFSPRGATGATVTGAGDGI